MFWGDTIISQISDVMDTNPSLTLSLNVGSWLPVGNDIDFTIPPNRCWKVGSYLPMPGGLQCSMHWFPPPVNYPLQYDPGC